MASIVLSFVGNQDTYSEKNNEEGSIVTLVRHLLKQNYTIDQINLLCTKETEKGAELTKEWLASELTLNHEIVNIFAVSSQLSEDPINSLLAIQEARKIIEKLQTKLSDKLEFNSSSGTPAMKSTWSILQAAGYAANSRVWQVRNPEKLQACQELVFQNNVNIVKDELDARVIKNQVEHYNYSGALAFLKDTNFANQSIRALLEYGQYRLAFDFDRAFDIIQKSQEVFDGRFRQEISSLRQKNKSAILKDVYYKILTKCKNQEYADVLILVFAFQENLLRLAVREKILPSNLINKNWQDVKNYFKQSIQNKDSGDLWKHLENYRRRGGYKLRLEFDSTPNRILMQAILEYYKDASELLRLTNAIDGYCEDRNDYVHELEGISELPNEAKLIKTLRELLKLINSPPEENPFNILNSHIYLLLDNHLRG